MIKYLTIALLGVSLTTQAQTVILEEDFTSGIPTTWATFDEDGLIPNTDVAEFTSAWIGAIFGSDTAAASTSYYENDSTAANDFLVTSKISLGNFSRLLWSARSVDASYPDGYQVLISTTDSLPGSFTDTLMTIVAETSYFSDRGIELDAAGYENQDVYIAFRNNTVNGYVLLIDDVKVLGAEIAGTICTIKPNITTTVYPNPTADILNIYTEEEIISATVYNTSGHVLITAQSNRIDVSELKTGMYFVQIETIDGIETSQFVKL